VIVVLLLMLMGLTALFLGMVGVAIHADDRKRRRGGLRKVSADRAGPFWVLRSLPERS
jgi:hypothetical protein